MYVYTHRCRCCVSHRAGVSIECAPRQLKATRRVVPSTFFVPQVTVDLVRRVSTTNTTRPQKASLVNKGYPGTRSKFSIVFSAWTRKLATGAVATLQRPGITSGALQGPYD